MEEVREIQTKIGLASYYTLKDVYEDGLAVLVSVKGKIKEHEFTFPKSVDLKPHELDIVVSIFLNGYEQGRQKGRWEKARKLRELFDAIKLETI